MSSCRPTDKRRYDADGTYLLQSNRTILQRYLWELSLYKTDIISVKNQVKAMNKDQTDLVVRNLFGLLVEFWVKIGTAIEEEFCQY